MDQRTSPPVLANGRRVTLLPRSGGQSWTGIVRSWDVDAPPRVVAGVEAPRPAVSALDHHQLWLSTVSASDGEYGITIFAGRAAAVGDERLQVDGVVRLATEPRRRAVRGGGASVSFPGRDTHGPLAVLDLSRGGLRLHATEVEWLDGGEVELVLHLDAEEDVKAVGRLLRVDDAEQHAVLELVGLSGPDAAAVDRHVLARLDREAGSDG